MNERKILDLLILFVIVYSVYSINMWFARQYEDVPENKIPIPSQIVKNTAQLMKRNATKAIPLFIKDACSVLEVFTQKPLLNLKYKKPVKIDDNMITVIGITVFLAIMLINALLDVLKVKEEERARRKLNPDGERRQSLAEFANKKPLRRGSSKFGLQLFQIAESATSAEEEKKERRQIRPYTRGESINSYLSEAHRRHQEGSAPASINETSATETQPRLVKRQSVAKLFGARPVPMVRRSSFPALPLNPEVQALMLGHRQTSVDSDDEGDGRGRRVRIIRRF